VTRDKVSVITDIMLRKGTRKITERKVQETEDFGQTPGKETAKAERNRRHTRRTEFADVPLEKLSAGTKP
jgi:hypothetical protein